MSRMPHRPYAQRPAPALSWSMAGALLLGATALGGCFDRPAASPAAAAAAPAAEPVSMVDLRGDPSSGHVSSALADATAAGWAVRLEAIRMLRRVRLPGFSATLAGIASGTRSPFEQAAALEALAVGYPDDAASQLRALSAQFHGELPDEERLAVVILRYHVSACYDLAIDLLCDAGTDALFTTRALILASGPGMAPYLSRPRQAGLQLRTLLAVLASGAAGAPHAQADAQRISDANFPGAAVTAYSEVYRQQAVPLLQTCLQTDNGLGHPEAAEALGTLGVATAGADILRLLQGLPEIPATVTQRATYLLALGRLSFTPALDSLITASHDSASVTDHDGVTVWPISQAALAGLAHFPQQEAYDALISALAMTDRPAQVVAAAQALLDRKDQAAERSLADAARQLQAAGSFTEASLVAEDHERLLGLNRSRRDILAYVIRYHSPEGSYGILTDQPLIAVDEAGRTLRAHELSTTVVQEAIMLSRIDIGVAIRMRNDQALGRLKLGAEPIDDVDMIAH